MKNPPKYSEVCAIGEEAPPAVYSVESTVPPPFTRFAKSVPVVNSIFDTSGYIEAPVTPDDILAHSLLTPNL